MAGQLFVADCQLFSPFGAAGGYNFSSTLGLHSGPETVDFEMFSFLKFGDWHGQYC